MRRLHSIYSRLPSSIQPYARQWYRTLTRRIEARKGLEEGFVDEFFASTETYQQYQEEWQEGAVATIREQALDEFRTLAADGQFGDVGVEVGRRLYLLVRALEPKILVETGVCNGFSTLCMLAALDRNGSGHLTSIDYPYHASDSLESFRADTFEGYGGAAIPDAREPGWLVPDELRDHWTLVLGKSVRELPPVVTELDEIDLFIHDSEHSLPCMLFEFELAWEWLSPGGILLADDVDWNDGWERFVDLRATNDGSLGRGVGYARKDKA